jgi:hypothetical protein
VAILRVYNYLFTKPVVEDDWFECINPESLVEKTNARIWKNISGAKEFDRF